MDKHYYEQAVAGNGNKKSGLCYALCWAAVVLLMLFALIFGANTIVPDPDKLTIHWPSAFIMSICLALAAFVFMRKDYLRLEYDYILQDDVLEIYAILNRRRRKKLAALSMEQVYSISICSADSKTPKAAKEHRWFLDPGKTLYCVHYKAAGIDHAAKLELDDKLAILLKTNKRLRAGAWKNMEGKTTSYAGLS